MAEEVYFLNIVLESMLDRVDLRFSILDVMSILRHFREDNPLSESCDSGADFIISPDAENASFLCLFV